VQSVHGVVTPVGPTLLLDELVQHCNDTVTMSERCHRYAFHICTKRSQFFLCSGLL
jgi:hypothetical protein